MSECVLAVGEVFPLEKEKKKDSKEKVLGQTVGPGACFCLFGKRVDQLSVCELFTRSPLVSGLGWPGRAWNEHQAHSPSRPRPFQLAVLSDMLGLSPTGPGCPGIPRPCPTPGLLGTSPKALGGGALHPAWTAAGLQSPLLVGPSA